MQSSSETERPDKPAEAGGAAARSGVRPALRRALWAALACFLAVSFFPAGISSAGLHFGIISAVKSKVKELGKKVREHTTPGAVSVLEVSSFSVKIGWRDTALDEISFGIERRTESGDFLQIAAAAPGSQSYLDGGLGYGTTYYYRVRTLTPAGWSDYSAPAKAVTLGKGVAASNGNPMITGSGVGGGDGDGDGSMPGDNGGGGGGGSGASRTLSVSTGTTVLLRVKAEDPDGDPLSYVWSAASGTPTGAGTRFYWTAPLSSGAYVVTCDISDGRGGVAVMTFNIDVVNAPRVELNAAPKVVKPTGISSVTCRGLSARLPLSYAWDVAAGTYTLVNSTQIAWEAPSSSGSYNVGCSVTDADSVVDVGQTHIQVSTSPVIIVILFSDNILPGATSTLQADVVSPYGYPLTYSWDAGSGTIQAADSMAIWTAPQSTGVFVVGLTVDDGNGGVDSSSVEINVGSIPVVQSVTAVPRVVLPLGVSTLTCHATDQDSPVLTFSWLAQQGSLLELDPGRAAWTAPQDLGVYTIGCTAFDEQFNSSVPEETDVLVSTYPRIFSVTPKPGKVKSNLATSVFCDAETPYGVPLAYSWGVSPTSGSFSGSGSTITWSAPSATGTYTITCGAADGVTPEVFLSTTVLVNNPPEIGSMTVVPSVLMPAETSALTCYATDPDNGLAINYVWDFSSGTSWTNPQANQALWTAPADTGTYYGSCQVEDGEGGVAKESKDLIVTTGPVILELNSSPQIVSPSGTMNLLCIATAPHSEPLAYEWQVGSGSFTGSGSGVTWNAPVDIGTYPAACVVRTAGGGSAYAAIDLRVGLVPDVLDVTASPGFIRPGEISTVSCSVADTGMPGLSYQWTVTGGTLTLAGPSSGTWLAPESSGTYSVMCTASVNGGGSDNGAVLVRVGTGPVIDSLEADPPMIATGTASEIICNATAPASIPLTYTWQASSGSLSGSGSTVTWTAPDTKGTAVLSCTVTGGGGVAYSTVGVTVNAPPVSHGLRAEPPIVGTLEISTLTCLVTDQDNPELTFDWSVDGGTYTLLSSSVAAWRAPDATGTFRAGCQASDGDGGIVSSSVELLVATMPVISSLTAEPPQVSTSQTSSLVCVATAPAGASLSYVWSVGSGTLSTDGNTAVWTPPLIVGTYPVTCSVSGYNGGVAVRSVPVMVINPPKVTGISVVPTVVRPLGISTVTCSAYDPDSSSFTFVWTASSGSFTPLGRSSAAWNAPAATGTFSVSCEALDGDGGSASRSAEIIVATGTEILSFTAKPVAVKSGLDSSLVCVATAPDNAAITYAWSAPAGSTLTVTGEGQAGWTAPASTGTYPVTCSATADGVTASTEVALLVNNPPSINSFTLAPQVVFPGGISTVTCAATDPDNPALDYEWTFSGGTFTLLSPSQARWEAPQDTGSYTAECAVSDGEGGKATVNDTLLVSSGPSIISFSISPEQVPPGTEADLVCVATAPGSGTLVYGWIAASGTASGAGGEGVWQAPASTGVYHLGCSVTSGGITVTEDREVMVNTPPVLSAMAAVPAVLPPGGISTITCTASDAEDPVLAYTWDPGPGAYRLLGTSSIAWTAPESSTQAQVSCTVADSQGGSAMRTVSLYVSSRPVITALSVTPAAVSSGATAALVCAATAPAGVSFTYDWSAASGTFSSSSGASVSWYAPASTGTYLLTCTANGGAGGSDSLGAEVLVNNPPVISYLRASPATVQPLGVSTITCSASDPDNPVLYKWSLEAGTSQYFGPGQILWTAPASSGTYDIGCEVSDGEGGVDSETISIWSSTGPVVSEVKATPAQVSTGAFSDLVCTATSPVPGASLAYLWQIAEGTITGTGSAVTWQAPVSTGIFTAYCTVDDGQGTGTGQADILVNNPPVVGSVTVSPAVLTPGSVSTVTCYASDPDNPVLFYNWTLEGGATSYLGIGSMLWTAPASTGSFKVTCEASDGEGGLDTGEAFLLVATGPVITKFEAEPKMVPSLGSVQLLCESTAPAGAALSYAWNAASGSISGLGSTATWTAPASTGTYPVGCVVTGSGGSAAAWLPLLVNSPATVSSVTASASVVSTGVPVELACHASDPDGDALTYAWTADAGEVQGGGSTVNWVSPLSTGSYQVTCRAGDGKSEDTGQASVPILVATGPVIRTLTASPDMVPRLGNSYITCDATSPVGALSYVFSAETGTLSAYVSSASWTAPDATGTFSVGCAVSAPGFASIISSVSILVNSPPAIGSLTASPSVLSTGAVSVLECAASDPDSDELSYEWSVTGGTLTGSGSTVTWTAPELTGSYSAGCTVSDGKENGSANASVDLLVSTGPTITDITVSPDIVARNATSYITCVATAPGGGTLTYTWLPATGAFVSYGSSAAWTAPDATGTYTIGCRVDAGPDSVSAYADVLVNSPPAISALTADPGVVSTGAVSTMTCSAADPDGDPLTYTWQSAAGSFSGSGPVSYWTAPQSTGTYPLTCEVTDGKRGGKVQSVATVLVATQPVISSFQISPTMTPRSGTAQLVCTATAPANAPIVYDWLADSGTFAAYVTSATWTAPDSTGTYPLACRATAGGRSAVSWGEIIVNSMPVVSTVTASPVPASTQAAVALVCGATDPDGDALTYTWSAATGTFSGSGSSVTWTTPDSTGTYLVTCRATDGKPDSFGQMSAQVVVATGPVITRLAAAPETLPRNGTSYVTCLATAPVGAVTYSFYVSGDSGTLVQYVSSAAWTAPNATGTWNLGCVATAAGASAFGEVPVLVNSPPVVSSVSVYPSLVSTGSAAALTCHASDPDGDQLEYTWSADTGAFTGSGSTVTWSSDLTGVFAITCSVSDGKPLAAQGAAQVIVATGPTITDLTVTPMQLPRNSDAEAVCVATAPDSAAITYEWAAASGSFTAYVTSATWHAPDSTGTYAITCRALSGGATAAASASVLVNSPPTLNSLTAAPAFVSTGASSALTCSASDPDGEPLSYTWTTTGGALVGAGSTVTWTAPASTGSYSASCQVSDGHAGSSPSATVQLEVSTGPTIISLTAGDDYLPRQGSTNLVCVATAPDSAALSYNWTASSGSISSYRSTATWTAPNATGTFTISCEASAAGKTAQAALDILVNGAPVISAVTPASLIVASGAPVGVTCSASDPDGDALVYTWTASTGSFSGSGPAVTWTAGPSSGTYALTCQVSDGKANGTVSSYAEVLVATGPMIQQFTVAPTPVPRLGTSYAVCQATAPGGSALSYGWTATGGSFSDVYQSSAAWSAPDATGTYTLGCRVSYAGSASSSTATADVLVNSPPLISALTAQPAFVSTVSVSTLTCTAADPDGDVIGYTWLAETGTINGIGSQVEWTSSLATGSWRVTCLASDGNIGGTAQREVYVNVATFPHISSLSAAPDRVNTSGISTFTCSAAAPGDGAVSYGWYASSGSTQAIAGDGSQMRWTAPAATGTYSVACVAGGAGGSDSAVLPILVNNPPVISALSADPVNVATGAVSTVTCTASDPDNAVLFYNWTVPDGSYSTILSSQIAWTAPATPGSYSISCTVSDGEGGVAQSTITIMGRANSDPVIDSLTASPAASVSGGTVTVTCSASDFDADPLTYGWSAASGTLTGSGSDVSWNAPVATGTYLVGCSVSDGRGGSSSSTVAILVNNPPVITGLAADPALVSTTSVSTITCTAHDTDSGFVAFAWYAASGSTAAIAGDGSQVRWTSPSSTGTYQVQCTALDGEGGSAVEAVTLTVSTVPVMQSLYAIPTRVTPNGTALFTCGATGQNSLAVSYGWTATCGSTAAVGGHPEEMTWSAPASTAVCNITCSASAGGGTAYQSLSILANTAPNLASLTATPQVLAPLAVSTLACNASDADGETLDYTWTALYGSTAAVPGFASSATWTAPAATGTYSVGCSVTDGKDTVETSVTLTVSTVPLITSLVAMPPNVMTTGVSTVTCAASDPGGDDVVSYSWSATGGSLTSLGGDNSQQRWTAPASSGAYQVTCAATSGGGTAYATVQVTAGGTMDWITEDGSTGSNTGKSVAVDSAGNVFVAGIVTAQLGAGTTYYGANDAFVAKYNSSGVRQWVAQFGTSSDDNAAAVAVSAAGDVYVAGYTVGVFTGEANAGGADAFLAKYNSSGAQQWIREFGTANNEYYSAAGYGFGVAVDASGSVYVAGATAGSFPSFTLSGASDAFLAKYNSSGVQQWVSQYGSNAADGAYGVTVDASGAIYTAGIANGSVAAGTTYYGLQDAYVAKYSNAGTQLWVRQLGTGANDSARGISADLYGGGIYIAGPTNGSLGGTTAGGIDSFVARYDVNGSTVWVRQTGTSATDNCFSVSASSGYVYIAGATLGVFPNTTSQGAQDFFAARYGSDGTSYWVQQYGSPSGDTGYGVAVTTSGEALLTGEVLGALPGKAMIGSRDFFVAKFAK